MHKKVVLYPGKTCVVFRKGPLGYLLQDPSDEARRIKDNTKLQNKSVAMREDLVHQNALTVVRHRGGDASDRREVQGEYILQFGKYKGKSFRWLLENDVGYTMYLIKSLQKEEAAGIAMAERHSKDSLQSFVQYALSFTEIKSLQDYEASRVSAAAEVSCEDDQLVGFGLPSKSTRKEIWDGRGDGYVAFIMEKSCIQGTRMYKLQQYLRKKHQSASASTRTSTKPIGMDDDKELEEAMLSVSPEKLEANSFTVPAAAAAAAEVPTPRVPSGAKTAPSAALSIPPSDTTTELQASSADGAASKDEKSKVPVPVPKELSFLLKETTDQTQGPESNPGPSTSVACTSVRKVLTFEDSNEDGVEKAGYHWVDRDCCAPFKIPDCIPGENLDWDAWKTTPAIIAAATSGPLANSCASRTNYNPNIVVKLDLFHCLRRFSRECTSEHHPLFSTFCQLLSAAFSVVDQEDLKRLQDAYEFCGINPANPTKQHIREHCRIKIPQPTELLNRVEKVLKHFHQTTDPNNIPLFKPSMLKVWRVQRVHILRGCLSDPELSEGVMFRYGGTLQLNHVPGEGAKVPIWIPVRGTSQQEGYHFHQAQWITGTHVSTELFQAQGMTGVARWNYQRLVDLKQPGVILPAVFDPALVAELNAVSRRVTGQEKYPALHLSDRDTGERFGLEYREPGCRPIPLNWDKHKTLKTDEPAARPPPSSLQKAVSARLQVCPPSSSSSSSAVSGMAPPGSAPPVTDPLSAGVLLKQETPSEDIQEPTAVMEISDALPLPVRASPRSARTGPIKTGGRVFVLDHTRWTSPIKKAIDDLLQKHHGKKDLLKLVDQDYASMVHRSAMDPNSLLHPTSKLHISRYVKHLGKLLNTSSSLNTSPEKLVQTQQLWHALPEGSETQGPVRYFYCSRKVHQSYAAEGICNPKMPFEEFAQTEFFQRELQATKKRAEERMAKKRKRPESQQAGRLCRFCHMDLKQGPNSPHIHTGFPGVAGKYIYCPSKVYSRYRDKGMAKEMTWKQFQESPFYEAERHRWVEERKK
ncbi:uncharacterized protein LOC115800199 [Archocentrus centrarchus]|uniref:uncharacterized protein LOC115800199 n=1 Tax=Archocentrus centrarchus TaxID=63155 RepID=UPI0011EA056C|nr:uncharacterized protein LOC115800199 [Archocentrus centrarchus]